MEQKRNFNKKGQPSTWAGMKQELEQLRSDNLAKLAQIEELDSRNRLLGANIQGLNKTIANREVTITKQAGIINGLQADKNRLEIEVMLQKEKVSGLRRRSLWARIFNREV